MRKINDIELRKMIESGKPQKECAAYYGVSPSAINQRIKKLQAYAAPESFKKLTDKQKEFVLCKVEGKTNLQAAIASHDVTSDASGKSMATQLMRDPDVAVAIQDLMAQAGIPRRRRIERLRDMIECPDLSVTGKGLDMSFKLTGEYAPVKSDTFVDYLSLNIAATVAELRAMLAETKINQNEPD